MKTANKLLMSLLVLISLIFLELPALVHAAVMEDYCVIPPYVKRDVSVNIMIMLDNSTDMSGPAYGSTYSPSATKDNYYGYFDSQGCYCPDISNRFLEVGAVNYTAYTSTGCPTAAVAGICTTGQYNGNILNWATMSGFAVAKKVIDGGRYTSVPVPQFTLEGDDWPARSAQGCSWDVDGSGTNIRLLVTEPGAPGSCPYPKNTSGWNLVIYRTTEPTIGVLQEFSDVNPQDENFDNNSPRFGITFFTNTGVNVSQYIPPNNFENFHNDIKTLTSSARNNDLATAHKTIIDYFDNESPVSGTDPYKSCASWESPCVSPASCRKSFILMLTTGIDVSGTTFLSLPSECSDIETRPLVRNACYAYYTDLRTDLNGRQNVSTYIVHTFGSATNQSTLQAAAVQGGGMYYSADASNLTDKLRQALQDIIKRSAAGTAASVLASGEGSGANLIQAVFYPRKKFYNSTTGMYDEIAWIGRLTNLWFYVDPYFTNSNIREDTTRDNILNLSNDYITQLYFDNTAELTKAMRWQDTDGDGDADGSKLSPDIEFEKIGSLWEAGLELWKRDIGSSPRKIYTTINGDSPLTPPTDFSTANAGTLQSYLQAADTNEAQAIIRYIHGEDNPVVSGTTYSYRSRAVAVDLNGDGDTLDAGEGAKVWKLGDVLNSTPKISSWIQLNNYDKIYGDGTYKEYLNSSAYTGRGMIFAGANDGMLHAFNLGKLELSGTWKDAAAKKARLSDPLSIGLGKELWAFIPKNALPYLKYTTNPDYCHIYTVDLTPFIFDASINGNPFAPKTASSWRTILIGGMRFGGACRNAGSACTNCVKTPVTDLGYSSYFALDITDTLAHQDDPAGHPPQFLWEFSSENLGFATTGPAVVRIGDRDKNGKWYVVFGSGPTGPTTGSGSTDYQFLGRSDQNLRLFILDLNGPLSGTWTSEIDYWVKDTGISNAFAGSMLNSTNDTDLDYQDDAVYIPYVKQDTSAGTWTQGGVVRLLTRENVDPSTWQPSRVIDNIGPVTSAVARLQHKSKGQLWLFFGTGRYYFELLSSVDDQDGQRQLFGITEPCFQNGTFATGCTDSRTISDLTQVNLASASGVSDNEGWYINLDASAGGYRAERLITDPIASLTGIVFFTTYKPYNDVCALGGKSFIWAANYNTGGASGASLKGIALLQVSTGSIEQINLSTALTEKEGRRTSAMEGVPPTAQGLSLLSQPPPVKRTIHIKER
jgi:Tfp pilus tip-associated adhesin PilY1